MVRRSSVQPGRSRRIIRPGMARAGVIDDVIDQHLHAEFVRVGDQGLIFLHGAHVVVERVKVDDVISVIVGVSILPYRSEPDGGDSEIVQISKMLANAAQVATVVSPRLSAVINPG